MMLTVCCAAQYWDDAADVMRPGEGTLLPLWKFTHRRAKRKQVGPLAFKHTSCSACGVASLAMPATEIQRQTTARLRRAHDLGWQPFPHSSTLTMGDMRRPISVHLHRDSDESHTFSTAVR